MLSLGDYDPLGEPLRDFRPLKAIQRNHLREVLTNTLKVFRPLGTTRRELSMEVTPLGDYDHLGKFRPL